LKLSQRLVPSKKPENLTGVLLLSEQKIATVRLIEQVLEDYCSSAGVELDSRTIAQMTPEDLQPGVLPIFCRTADVRSREWMRQLTQAKWPFLYYIDDDFWSLDKATELGRFYGRPIVRKALAHAIENSFVTLASTNYLASKLAGFEADIRVMTPHVHPYLLERTARVGERGRKGRLRLGFASNISRLEDLSFLLPELEDLLTQNPDWEIDFIGVAPDIDRAAGNVNFLPYQHDYFSYVDLIRERKWDIVLSPLRDTESARSKTNNKYREFAALGVPGVFSAVGAYKEVIDGQLGIVVENTAEAWREGILRLADNAELRHSIARAATADARNKYALGHVVEEWAAVFDEVAPSIPRASHAFVEPQIRHRYWHAFQDLVYETAVITRLSGPTSGGAFVARRVLWLPYYLARQVLRKIHSLWVEKILVLVHPDAVTRVWAGDFSKKDLGRLETSGHTTVRRRIRSLRKRNLGDQAGGVLAFDVPQSPPGGISGVFVRLDPYASSANITIDLVRANQVIDSETCLLDPLATFTFIPLPSPPRGVGSRGKVRATLSLNRGSEAVPEDITFVVDLTRGDSPIVVERTQDF
jgi:glycosyltransferase involved in cell wall biosynthesis